MGAAFSSSQLQGAQPSINGAPPPALPTSYAFKSDNTNSFGFTATFTAAVTDVNTAKSIISPTVTFPLKAGGSTAVACGPASITIDATGTSITCPIANTLIGPGTAQFAFTPTTTGGFGTSSTYLIAFTTLDQDNYVTSTVTATNDAACSTNTWAATTIKEPWVPKNCRPLKKSEGDAHGLPRRDVAGYGPPDVTFTGAGAVVTTTTTVTSCGGGSHGYRA